jgi:hypothetical protein
VHNKCFRCATADAAKQELDDVTLLKLQKLVTTATSAMYGGAMKLKRGDDKNCHTDCVHPAYEVYTIMFYTAIPMYIYIYACMCILSMREQHCCN